MELMYIRVVGKNNVLVSLQFFGKVTIENLQIVVEGKCHILDVFALRLPQVLQGISIDKAKAHRSRIVSIVLHL